MGDLENIYAHYKSVLGRVSIGESIETDKQGNKITIDCEMFRYLVDYYKMNEFPKVVADEEFDKMPCRMLYHGYKTEEHAANMMCHFDYHYGTGYLNGMFFTLDSSIALRYTRSSYKDMADVDKILPVKISSEKFMTIADLLKIKEARKIQDLPEKTSKEQKEKLQNLYNFASGLKKREANDFLKIMKTLSNLAVYLGLDYVKEPRVKHYIVLNRGILTIPQSKFELLISKSEHYKTGYFDYYDCESQPQT